METRGRKQKVSKSKRSNCPYSWRNEFTGRYKISCQETSTPYFDKHDKLWKIVLYDIKEPQYIIYDFKNKIYNRVFYDDSIQK